jgi:hypothetical protein
LFDLIETILISAMAPNIKDIKPWEPHNSQHTNDSNREMITLSTLPDEHNKDQPVAETMTASSKGTQTPLHDEST